jgi:hypothetical protein
MNLTVRKFWILSAVLATTALPSSSAAGDVADQALDRAFWIFDNARIVHYEHLQESARKQISELRTGGCEAKTDCSGFVSSVLRDVAPKHYDVVRRLQPQRPYPQAKSYAKFFSQLNPSRPSSGWIGVPNYADLRRGDLIAWAKQPNPRDGKRKGNSGHVMFVLDPPGPVTEETIDGTPIRFVAVRVLDSSSVYHFQPEKLPPLAGQLHRDGLGIGYVRLILNDQNRAVGYWEGTYWGEGGKALKKPSFTDLLGFGRLLRS